MPARDDQRPAYGTARAARASYLHTTALGLVIRQPGRAIIPRDVRPGDEPSNGGELRRQWQSDRRQDLREFATL